MRGRDARIASAYDARAAEYVGAAGSLAAMDARDIATIRRWRDDTRGALLDAGSGPGHWTAFLADTGREARGVDVSAALIASARIAHPGIRFDVGSFRALPVDAGSMGGILAWYSLIHTDPADVPGILRELARVLRPGGTLLLGYFEGEPRLRFDHAIAPAFFWSADALGALLAVAGLELESSERRDRVPGEISARPHGSLIARRR